MMRLVGILTGSALAVAVLIVALGVPELAPPADQAPAAPEPAAPESESLDDQALPVELPAQEPAEPGSSTALEVPPQATAPAATEANLPAGKPMVSPAPEQNWYAFWSPFRSRIAAEGFVAELQRTTGLDYRVVKLKPGVYEVAFAYASDADIQDKLMQISAATGLDMSGG